MENPNDVDSMSERRERSDARENRQQILTVAKHLFATQGVAATSMKEIARAAGVGQGTLYRNFAHKGELCGAMIKEDLHEFQDRVGALIGDAHTEISPLARLDRLLDERAHMTESHLPLFSAIEEATSGDQRKKHFRGPFGIWTHERIKELLTEAVARGEVADIDITFTADAILAASSPQLYSYQRHACGYSVERIISGMRRLYVDGLRREVVV